MAYLEISIFPDHVTRSPDIASLGDGLK